MKLRKVTSALFTTLLLGIFLGGCATTGMDRSVDTSDSIKDVDLEIRKMMAQIDVTSASLNSVVIAGEPDLKKNFNSYSDNVGKLESQGERALKRVDEMKTNSAEYFAQWDKQGNAYTNSQIREASEERRRKLADIYAQVPAAGAGIRGAYMAYMADLKEIQLYLSNDLTPNGVQAITPVAHKTVQNLDLLKGSLKPVISALDEINAELYSGKK